MIKSLTIPSGFLDGVLDLNPQLAYAGQTADTVTLIFTRKANIDVRFKQLLQLLVKSLPREISETPRRLDDSVSRTFKMLANPNIYFKARFIQFLDGNPDALDKKGKTWDSYWLHFYNKTGPKEPFTLLEPNSTNPNKKMTQAVYPEFWTRKDVKIGCITSRLEVIVSYFSVEE